MQQPSKLKRFINRKKAPLNVYWMIENIKGKQNFGDELTPLLIEKIWGYRCKWSSIGTCDLAGVGSILDILQTQSKGNHIKVWGSGFIKEGPDNTYENLDFYAVRGPETLKRIKPTRNVALGDPGLLASLVFEKSKSITHKVGVVAHYVDLDSPALEGIRNNKNYKIISPLQSPQEVALDITSCEIVFSSSLHGLIFADCFDIPNYWMPFSDKVIGGAYKFNDYYATTGRELTKKSVEILSDDKEIEKAIESYKSVKNLEKIQQNIIKSFPY